MNSIQIHNSTSRIDNYTSEIIEMQERLTAAQAVGPLNGGKGEYEKAEYLKKMLPLLNPTNIIEINVPDTSVPNGYRPNIAALFNGEYKKRLWIISHLDVVPAGDLTLWNSDPFRVELKEEKLYGRGVEDNQQSLVASYMALKALREEELSPKLSIGLLMVSDEETGSEKGLKFLIDNHRNLFKMNDLFLIPDGGNNEGTMIEIAEKTILWLKFRVLGKQGHASKPNDAVNSFRASSHLVITLDNLHHRYQKQNSLFSPQRSTFEPTKKEGNVSNINTIPGEDTFYLDCRILPEINVDDVIASSKKLAEKIEKQFNVQVEISQIQRGDAAPPTSTHAPIVKHLQKSIKTITHRDANPMGIGGATVALFLRKAGFPVAVWSTIDGTAHQSNEYCILSNLISDAKVFVTMMLQDI